MKLNFRNWLEAEDHGYGPYVYDDYKGYANMPADFSSRDMAYQDSKNTSYGMLSKQLQNNKENALKHMQNRPHICVPVYVDEGDWRPYDYEGEEDSPANCKETAEWHFPYKQWKNWDKIEQILKGKPYSLWVDFDQNYYHDCAFEAEAQILLNQEQALAIIELAGTEGAIHLETNNYVPLGTKRYTTIEQLIKDIAKEADIPLPNEVKQIKKGDNYAWNKELVDRKTAGTSFDSPQDEPKINPVYKRPGVNPYGD